MALTRDELLFALELVGRCETYANVDVVGFARELQTEHELGMYAFKHIARLPTPDQFRILGAVREMESYHEAFNG
jgi:hypothetical protein